MLLATFGSYHSSWLGFEKGCDQNSEGQIKQGGIGVLIGKPVHQRKSAERDYAISRTKGMINFVKINFLRMCFYITYLCMGTNSVDRVKIVNLLYCKRDYN